ncbi:hypothetical protein L1987_03549 [Smallanthus sonchifolius]|uniref:Uncharacterized protein n=1 Tax=Smallanthus sonchifolius TaxID=185202 RepID=A0ACB9KAW4_9ASTR|nr:hypothetical protein L1987_03549 [Smallanthus sonchifolius]
MLNINNTWAGREAATAIVLPGLVERLQQPLFCGDLLDLEYLTLSSTKRTLESKGDCIFATSLLNSGMYELDFEWGKPIWFYLMNARLVRRVVLNETLKGGGVEAIVTLSPDEMEIFESDSELLSYATINPSPLRFVH